MSSTKPAEPKPPNRKELQERGYAIQKLGLHLLEVGGDVRKRRITIEQAKTAINAVSRSLRKAVSVANGNA
jgi:hypothetical protein